jgi:hypothetical protein
MVKTRGEEKIYQVDFGGGNNVGCCKALGMMLDLSSNVDGGRNWDADAAGHELLVMWGQLAGPLPCAASVILIDDEPHIA